MNWIFIGLLAPLVLTLVNFIDKYVLEHKVKDSRGMPVYGALTALVLGTTIWLSTGMPSLSTRNTLLVMAAGMISLWGGALYFYGLSKSQTSYIIALLQTTPLFTLLLSLIFLHETLTLLQSVGFFVVFSAVLGLSIEDGSRRVKLDKAFWATIAANFCFAVAAVVVKFTIGLNGFLAILTYESWGLALGGLVLFTVFGSVRQAFFLSARSVGRRTMSIMLFNESLFATSKALTFWAISLGPVALVGVLGGSQVFYGLALGLLLTFLFPHLFHEDTAKRNLLKKIAFSCLLFGGVWCIGAV